MNILFVIKSISFADHISIAHLSAIAKQQGHSTFLCILDQDDLDSIALSRKSDITCTHYSVTDPIKKTALYQYCLEYNYINKDYNGDMTNCDKKSILNCFSKKDKKIRYNIFLLGPVASKVPFPLNKVTIWLIKHAPSNLFFEKIHDWHLSYMYKNKIFKIKK